MHPTCLLLPMARNIPSVEMALWKTASLAACFHLSLQTRFMSYQILGVGGQRLAVGRRERKRKRKKKAWQDEGNVQNLITRINVTIGKGQRKGRQYGEGKKKKGEKKISNEPDAN